MSDPASLGRDFATALAAKDFDRIRELVDDHIDFRGLTPNRAWEASGPSELVSVVLKQWLEEGDEVDELVSVETGEFADRQTLDYVMRVHNDEDGECLVEQQAYFTERDGRIDWMRIICSGFRPV